MDRSQDNDEGDMATSKPADDDDEGDTATSKPADDDDKEEKEEEEEDDVKLKLKPAHHNPMTDATQTPRDPSR